MRRAAEEHAAASANGHRAEACGLDLQAAMENLRLNGRGSGEESLLKQPILFFLPLFAKYRGFSSNNLVFLFFLFLLFSIKY